MALTTTALIVLAQNYAGDIVRQINRRSVLLATLPIVPDEGKNVAWVAEGDDGYAAGFSEGADVPAYGGAVQSAAILQWAQYWSTFAMSGLSMATAATSRTPLGNVDLWARHVINGAAKLSTLLNADLYTGDGSVAHPMIGLDSAIGLTTNTYATIDRTSNSFWRPYVVDPGVATALTFDQIRLDLGTIYQNSGFRPDMAVVNPAVFRKIAALFDPLKQYWFSTLGAEYVKSVRSQRGEFQLEGGVGAISFDGCTIFEDKDCPNNAIYYLNSEWVDIKYLPFDMSSVPGLADETMDVMVNDGIEMLPLGLQLEMVAKTGDADKAFMKSYLQLQVKRPNSCGKRLNVSTA